MAAAGNLKMKRSSCKEIVPATLTIIFSSLFAAFFMTGALIYFVSDKNVDIETMCKSLQDKTAPPRTWIPRWILDVFGLSPEPNTEDSGLAKSYVNALQENVCALVTGLGLLDLLANASLQIKLCWNQTFETVKFAGDQAVRFANGQYSSHDKYHSLSSLAILSFGMSGVAFAFCFLCMKFGKQFNKKTHSHNSKDLSYSSDDVSFEHPDSCMHNFQPLAKVKAHRVSSRDLRYKLTNQVTWILHVVFYCLIGAAALSIPWEFFWLYHKAVATRASKILQGVPEECDPQSMTFLHSLRSFLQAQFSWNHGSDPCFQYHYALLVDPIWEIPPLMVLSSALARCVLHPLELVCAALGRGVRVFFSEIPLQWQPLLMLVIIAVLLLLILTLARYRLVIPLLLRIEPRTPVSSANSQSHPHQTELSGSPACNKGHLQMHLCKQPRSLFTGANPSCGTADTVDCRSLSRSRSYGASIKIQQKMGSYSTDSSVSVDESFPTNNELEVASERDKGTTPFTSVKLKDVSYKNGLNRAHTTAEQRFEAYQLSRGELNKSSKLKNEKCSGLSSTRVTGDPRSSLQSETFHPLAIKDGHNKPQHEPLSLVKSLIKSKSDKENYHVLSSSRGRSAKRKGKGRGQKTKDDTLWSPCTEIISDSE